MERGGPQVGRGDKLPGSSQALEGSRPSPHLSTSPQFWPSHPSTPIPSFLETHVNSQCSFGESEILLTDDFDRSDISYLPVFGLLEHYLVFNTSTLILPGFPFIMNCYLLKKFFHLVFHLSNPSFICVFLIFIPSIDYSILSAEYLIPKYFYLFLI